MLTILDSASVLITGGTGSFGRAFVKTVLSDYQPDRVIVFSRDELKQHEMRTGGYDDERLRYFIGDVRDLSRLRRAFRGVDIVVHAAAMKQVPACEYNPAEAVATNVGGARSVIDAALDCGVSRVIALSSDKATSPTNLYGGTKLLMEKLMTQANAYSGRQAARFACVRYGNVLGSRGSVLPVFREQAKVGRLTLTDARMTRFWLTLPQAVAFVISSLEMMHGGEIFIPKLPSASITDLALAVAPDCEMETIGIRPGEKLAESLVSSDEAHRTIDTGDRYVILPSYASWSLASYDGAPRMPDGWSYSSDANEWRLSVEELREMIDHAG